MDAWLPLLEPGLSATLGSTGARGDLSGLASAIPLEAALSRFGFSYPLDDSGESVHLLVSFTRRAGNGAALARLPQPCPALAQAWTGGLLRDLVDDVWLTFEVPPCAPRTAASQAAHTSLLPRPHLSFGPTHDEIEGPFPWAFYADTLNPAFKLVLGSEPWQAVRPAVSMLLDRLPPFARVCQAGAALSPPLAPCVRLCIGFLPAERVLPTFEALALPPALVSLAIPHLERLSASASRIALTVDVTPDGPLPRLGIEWHGPDQHLCRLGPSARALLDDLAGQGAAVPERIQALEAWPGEISSLDRPGGWPPALDVASNSLLRARTAHLVRRLSHVELTLHAPDVPPRARAALCVDFAWRPLGARGVDAPSTAAPPPPSFGHP